MGKRKRAEPPGVVVVVVVPERRWFLKTIAGGVVSAVAAKVVDIVWWRPAPTIVAGTGSAAGTSSAVAHGVRITPGAATISLTVLAPTVRVG